MSKQPKIKITFDSAEENIPNELNTESVLHSNSLSDPTTRKTNLVENKEGIAKSNGTVMVCPITGMSSLTNPHEKPSNAQRLNQSENPNSRYSEESKTEVFVCPVTGMTSKVNPHSNSNLREVDREKNISGNTSVPSECPYKSISTGGEKCPYDKEGDIIRLQCIFCKLYPFHPIPFDGSYACQYCVRRHDPNNIQHEKQLPNSYTEFLVKSTIDMEWATALVQNNIIYSQRSPYEIVSITTNMDSDTLKDEAIQNLFYEKSVCYMQIALSYAKIGNRTATIYYLNSAYDILSNMISNQMEGKVLDRKLNFKLFTLCGSILGMLGDLQLTTLEKEEYYKKSLEMLRLSKDESDDTNQAISTTLKKWISIQSSKNIELYREYITVLQKRIDSYPSVRADLIIQKAESLVQYGTLLIQNNEKGEANRAYTDALEILMRLESELHSLSLGTRERIRIEEVRNLISEKLNATRE